MTTARNLRKKIALSLCTSYLKRIPFFFQQSLSSALSGFSVACIPHTSKTTLKHFAHPVGLFQIAAARDSVYVCLCVLVHTPRSSKSWCFFFFDQSQMGKLCSTLECICTYIYIGHCVCMSALSWVGGLWVGVRACMFLKTQLSQTPILSAHDHNHNLGGQKPTFLPITEPNLC